MKGGLVGFVKKPLLVGGAYAIKNFSNLLYFVKCGKFAPGIRKRYYNFYKLFFSLSRRKTGTFEFLTSYLQSLPEAEACRLVEDALAIRGNSAAYPENIRLVAYAVVMTQAFLSKDWRQLLIYLRQSHPIIQGGARQEPGAANVVRDLSSVLPRSLNVQTNTLSTNYRKAVPAKKSRAPRLAVIVDGGELPVAGFQRILALYSCLESVHVAFLGPVSETQRAKLRNTDYGADISAEYSELPMAYAVTDMPDAAGAAYVMADHLGNSVEKGLSSVPQDHFVFFHEPLLLSIEGRYYRYLSSVKATDRFLNQGFDEVLVIGGGGDYFPSIISVCKNYFDDQNLKVSTLGARVETLPACLAAIRRHGRLEKRGSVPETYRLGGFRPPHPYVSASYGPLRPSVDQEGFPVLSPESLEKRLTRTDSAAASLRAFYAEEMSERSLDDILAGVVRDYGQIDTAPDEPWICLVVNLGERVYGDLYLEILQHYLPRRKVLVIDHTARKNSLSEEEERALFGDARCCRVVDFLALAAPDRVPAKRIALGRRRSLSHIYAGVWKDVDLLIGQKAFVETMESAERLVWRRVLGHHLRVGASTLDVLARLRVEALVVFPTRNTHMRMTAQAARLWGIPTLEAQTLLGGMVTRHRAPNTDICVLLESWSKGHFTDYLGYPAERSKLGGSLRFDKMLSGIKGGAAESEIETLRATLFPAAPHRFPLVVFGTQPVEAELNRYCLKLLLEACQGIEGCRVVIKTHPAEPEAVADSYAEIVSKLMPQGHAVVTASADTVRLMVASDLVVSQSSNILLEAAVLDRRACALNFTELPAPVDFAGMGVAVEIRDPLALRSALVELVTAPSGTHALDQSRREYLTANPQLVEIGYMDRLSGLIDHLAEHVATLPDTMPESRLSFEPSRRRQPLVCRTSVPAAGNGGRDDVSVQVQDLDGLLRIYADHWGSSFESFSAVMWGLPRKTLTSIEEEVSTLLGTGLGDARALYVIQAYITLRQGDVRGLVDATLQLSRLSTMPGDGGAQALPHLQVFNACLPHSLTEVRAQLDGAVALAAPLCESDVRHLLVLTEGDIDSDVARDMISRSFPACEHVTVSFLSRHNNIVERFQEELLGEVGPDYRFIDLLADYTGNYVPTINSIVGSSYIIGDLTVERLLEGLPEPLSHVFRALREPFSLSVEDHYYRYLRTLKSVSLLLDDVPVDGLLILAATPTNLTSVVAIAERKFSRDRIYAALPARNPGLLESVGQQLKVAVAADPAPTEVLAPSRLDAFRPPPPFCSYVAGPLRPPLGDQGLPSSRVEDYAARYAEAVDSVDYVRTFFQAMTPDSIVRLLEKVRVKTFGRRDTPTAPWVMLAVNFDDRVHKALYEDLIAHYRDTHKIVLIDFSKVGGEAIRTVEESLLQEALHVDVYHYRQIASGMALPPEFKVPVVSGGLSAFYSQVQADAGIGINLVDLARILHQADERAFTKVLPVNLWLAVVVMALARLHGISKAVVCPTRSSLMRLIAQSLRIMRVPSLEAQTVLNGRMVRHRAPNTDYCSVLETWSSEYYAQFFGYPRERLLLGGALRYDRIVEGVESEAAQMAIANLREELFPGMGSAPLLVFGTQPMQLSDNLFCIEHLLEACKTVAGTRVVIKVHPAEGEANRRVYEAVGRDLYPAGDLLVTAEVDTYHLMKCANLTVSQTSNILLEAGFLDCRALSLHFGAYPPPVDFEEMNAAIMLRDVEKLPEVVQDLLTAAPGTHWFDAHRRRFIEDNPQLVERAYRQKIVGFLDRLDHWHDGYEAMIQEDRARLEAFDPAAYGWRL